MRLKIFGTLLIIDFSFILVLSLAVLFGNDNIHFLLLFSFAHEIGHLIALTICRNRPECIILSFYGAGISYPQTLNTRQELFVLSGGVTVNFLLWLILRDNINLVLILMNILPVYPLDGGRVLRLLIPKASVIISGAILALLIIFAVYIKSFSLIIICFYLIAAPMIYGSY